MTPKPFVSKSTQDKIDKVIADAGLGHIPIRKLNILSCPDEILDSVDDGDGLLAGLLNLVTGLVGGLLGLLG